MLEAVLHYGRHVFQACSICLQLYCICQLNNGYIGTDLHMDIVNCLFWHLCKQTLSVFNGAQIWYIIEKRKGIETERRNVWSITQMDNDVISRSTWTNLKATRVELLLDIFCCHIKHKLSYWWFFRISSEQIH